MIGSLLPPDDEIEHDDGRLLKIIDGPNGCDTPVYTFDDCPRTCDPDLPPLAVEHPARVWNSLIHALEPGEQPVVKWSFEEVPMNEGKLKISILSWSDC